jgi:adenine phosphoribosyltransferase
MHADALLGKRRVLIVDDVVATGGTARASLQLAQDAGAEVVGATFLIELSFLRGRELLPGLRVESVLQY